MHSGRGAVSLDPRTPVLVGVGQVSQPELPAPDPAGMLADAARLAADDAGGRRLLERVETIRVVNLLSRGYPNPAALVAAQLGVAPRQTVYTTAGGNTPQVLVNRTAADIVAGHLDVALIGGAESWRTRSWYKARGERAPWPQQDPGVHPDVTIGEELVMASTEEMAIGLAAPVQLYPMFETALALESGVESPAGMAAWVARAAKLWAGFAAVAAANPYAALRGAPSAAEIASPGPANRMIGYPYPKLMCSNNSVDQAAALILCSAEAAAAAGVPSERWVFVHSGAQASDEVDVIRRDRLTRSPAVRAVGRHTLALAGLGIDDVELIDLYSCFPSAVQVAAGELGLGLDRQLTVTGGLTFAGGPWNDYVTHGIATMAAALRRRPGAFGLCTANGGNLTKHAAGLYSTTPPDARPRFAHPQAEVDATPARPVAAGHTGPATLEAFTVMHDREGRPEVAFAYGRTADDRRAVGASRDPAVLAALLGPSGVSGAGLEWVDAGTFTVAG